MLILTRNPGESIQISDNIKVIVLANNNGQVKLGFEAPKDVEIYRSELLETKKDR